MASADTTEQERYSNTVSGETVDFATSNKIKAEQKAAANPSAPLT